MILIIDNNNNEKMIYTTLKNIPYIKNRVKKVCLHDIFNREIGIPIKM